MRILYFKLAQTFCPVFFLLYLIAVLALLRLTLSPGLVERMRNLAVDSISTLNPAPEPVISWDFEGDDQNFGKRNITILMWTEYYHNKDLTDHIRNESPIPRWCNVTFNRSKLSESQALVFHIPGTDLNLKDLPPRKINQPWVYYIIEPPIYMSRATEPLNGLFNRTMTYRLDSDFPCLYGYLKKYKIPLPGNPYFENPGFPRKSKIKLVAWMVSHCSTSSRREEIAQKLKSYIPVDIYGLCGSSQCDPKDEEGCYKLLGQEYKFYLSFENSLCTDYITEKFSNALKYNLVPIVYGGGNYSAILPYPKSFINVEDFQDVKSLADYLLYLDKNDSAYAEYFEWKRFYQIRIRQGFSGFRRMCYALQSGDQERFKVYSNIKQWWLDGHYRQPTLEFMHD